jgi:hypothetical protein
MTTQVGGRASGEKRLSRGRSIRCQSLRALHQVGGADPKALEPTKRHAGGLKTVSAQSSLRQHLGVAPMHRGQAVSQFDPFFGQSNVHRAPIVHRALVREIFVSHHLLDVIGDVRAEIASAQRELADCHFDIANIEKHHCLDVVDVVDPEPFQLQLHHLQELTVKTLDERNDF